MTQTLDERRWTKGRLPFYSDCVGWPRDLVPVLCYLVEEGVEVGRGWFLRNVEVPNVLRELIDPRYYGHAFYRLPDYPVFWFTHSCIEYVFLREETLVELREVVR